MRCLQRKTHPPTFREEPEIEEEKTIGSILHANSSLLWESEYDATKESAISQNVPCAEIIETLKLKQLGYDGFFFDSDGKLAAFDVNLTQKHDCVVLRRELLDHFLKDRDLALVWLVDCQKEVHEPDGVSDWSEWEAVLTYEKNGINGNLRKMTTSRY